MSYSLSSRVLPILLIGALLAAMAGIGAMVLAPSHASGSQTPRDLKATSKAEANAMLQRQAACFVPNLGQWQHQGKFVHRSGPMTLFLEDRGWVLDLVERPAKPKARPHEPGPAAHAPGTDEARSMPGDGEVDQKIRGVALKMTFEGDTYVPEIVGEKKLRRPPQLLPRQRREPLAHRRAALRLGALRGSLPGHRPQAA